MSLKEIPQIEGFDFEYAMDIFQDESILKVILIDFYEALDELRDRLNGLYETIREDDNLSLYRLEVHALKSTSASVGALQISEQAKLLEEAAIAGDIERIGCKHPLLMEDIAKHKERLAVIIP
jgi:HPt (histidine-containing phosphotransfer) domain-containing protein